MRLCWFDKSGLFWTAATLILNWKEDGIIYEERQKENKSEFNERFLPMELNPWIRGLRLVLIILFTCADVGTIIYRINTEALGNTSYAGHAFGAIAGATIGVFILKNRKVEDWEVIFQWIVFGIYALLLCIFIIWHIVGGSFDYFPSSGLGRNC